MYLVDLAAYHRPHKYILFLIILFIDTHLNNNTYFFYIKYVFCIKWRLQIIHE